MDDRPLQSHRCASHELSAGAPRAYLEEWGHGTPLVCLHGLGGGAHFFAALGASLSDRAHVIAPDLPGAGHTVATVFSFDRAADLVVQIMRQESASGACVLGHSMSTIIALEVLRREPALVTGLILVGGLPEPLPASRTRLLARVERIRRGGLVGLGAEVVEANFSRRTRETRPELTALFARSFELQSAAGYAAIATALAQWTARPLPPLDGVPCLVATGEEDRYAPPEAVRAFARTLPDAARLEILPDCGHLPFLEQPTLFADLVAGFLTRLRAT